MVENMCRACLLSEESESPFHTLKIPHMESDSTIGIVFSRISQTQYDPDDGLPQKICQKCFEELSSSYEFQKKCIQSDLEIRNLVGKTFSECTETKKNDIKVEAGESEVEADIDDWITYSDDEKSENISDNLAEPIENLDQFQVERPNPKNKRKSRYKCEICNKVFDRSYSLNRHTKSHKPGQILNFECNICNCKFVSQKSLTKHLNEKHLDCNVGCYPCPSCPRKFMKKASRSAHMQCHKNESIENIKCNFEEQQDEKESKILDIDVKPLHLVENMNSIDKIDNTIQDKAIKTENDNNVCLNINKGTASDGDESDEVELPNPKNKRKAVHECDVCHKTFDRKYRLQRHLNIHNPEGRPYECQVCKWRFASEQNLTRHAIMHTAVADCIKQNNEKPKIYRCIYCPRKFAKKESLASHMRVHKSNMPQPEIQVKNFKCQFCPKAFYKITNLTRHLYTHDNEKDFKCNLCDKSFSLRGQLVDHMNWHKGIKPFQCEICTKSFNQSCTLKEHMRTHSGEKPFLCSECGKGFNSSSNLRQHIIRHTGDKPFKCSECPSSFTSNGGLKSHMSTHTKLKPHVCDLCGSSFTKRYSLKKHKRIHTGEKPYECTTCHMRFTSTNHLKRHIRTHTGEKPYACKYCERAFAQSNDLVKHLKSHLGDKIYKCNKCGESFRLQTELRDHQNGHYREERLLQDEMIPAHEEINNVIDENSKKVNENTLENEKIELKAELEETVIYPVEMQYQCRSCDSTFSTPENLNIHQINEHNKAENEK